MSDDPASTSGGRDGLRAKVRHVFFGELAVLAAKVNEFSYSMAIWANRAQGWLARQRDARP